MLNRIIQSSIRNKLIIILLTISIAGFGVYAIFQIPVGAVPDITNNQVQVITTSTNLSTQDVEQFITYPVELAMSNLPGVNEIRSISKFGLSVVTIVFEDNMGTYLPRQLISEKINAAAAEIPEGFGKPEMGPITTGLGEIYQYVLDTKPGYEDKYSIMELRTIQDWMVRRQLSGIPGVVEVNTWGGYLKQYEVAVDPSRLQRLDITLMDVFIALEANNNVAGGAYIEKTNQSYFIRGDGLVGSLEDLGRIVIGNRNGIPVLVSDVAEVRFGSANRFGAITANGKGETVMGQIMMLKDANSNKVIEAVKERVEEVQETLPEGIFINPIVERSELIGKTSHTVFENLLYGCLIVFLTVLLLMGNLRSGLVVASIIPLSLLFTISMMYIFGVDANLMSLGALDFGIIIDGAVIIVEFIVIRLTVNKEKLGNAAGEEKQNLMDSITFNGASRMINSAIFGQVIILIVFIPVLSLSGVEGKMFRPMALSFSFALLGAMFFGFTWLPVISSLFLRPEKDRPFILTRVVMRLIYRSYDPVIRWSYNHKAVIFGLALASLVGTGILFSRMGGEFVPTLDEGDFVIQPVLKTGTSLSKTIETTTKMENILIDNFPEVDQIVCRIGAAEVPTDPMSMEEIDMIIKLRPPKEWVSAESKEELASRFKEALEVLPGIEYEFTQPIEMRFNELITGVRADLAIKIFGEDLEILADKAEEVKELITGVPGAADIVLEKTEGLPQMSVQYHREKLAYYGLNVKELNNYISAGFAGGIAGSVFEGERKFDLVVRLQESSRDGIEDLRNLYVKLPGGSQVPLRELASIDYTTGPAKISRDDARRRVVVSVNVRNRDLESVVADIESILDENLVLPAGYSVDYGGQFENLRNASRRLKYTVPIALLLIFVFLHFAFGSIKKALLIFTAIPLSVVGGVTLLWLRGMPFSISAGIGFIALFGVAVLNGIVLVEYLQELKDQGIKDMKERVLKGTRERLRPVLLTASAAALGFLPMAISTSAGAEVQRPLATVVIGGLVTSTLLTMLALPLLYAVFDEYRWKRRRLIRGNKARTLSLFMLLILPAGILAQEPVPDTDSVRIFSLEQAISTAMENNSELAGWKARARESKALTGTAFSMDRTSVYYNYDENNVAENGYPIGVIGGEQRFDFPTLYSARKKALELSAEMSTDSYEQSKRVLEKEVSTAYYELHNLKRRVSFWNRIDSIYFKYAGAATFSYKQGEISYLEMLQAKQEYNRVSLMKEQLLLDIDLARVKLASLMNVNGSIDIRMDVPEVLETRPSTLSSDPGFSYFNHAVLQREAELKVARNLLMPDITLGYFNGSNNYADARNYQGFEVGLGIPLFFGEQKARVQAGKFGAEAAVKFRDDYQRRYESRLTALHARLGKHQMAISYYEETGRELSAEMIRAAKVSFESGEINFLEFTLMIDAALEIQMKYLDELLAYNQVVLEINYLTL